jgi:hypothetical protein
MVLDHERLDVYLVALDFVVFANEVIERLPHGRSHLADQLTRASTSCRWPSVISNVSGSPRASTIRWTFVDRPPRERPMPFCAPPLSLQRNAGERG